jgi:hypothetical protein
MATYYQSWMKTAHNKGHEPPPKLDEEVALLRQEAVITISSPDNDQQYEQNYQKSIPKPTVKRIRRIVKWSIRITFIWNHADDFPPAIFLILCIVIIEGIAFSSIFPSFHERKSCFRCCTDKDKKEFSYNLIYNMWR